MTTVLGLFAKPPVPGTVKTRLAADIGDEAAASLYAAFVRDLLQTHADSADGADNRIIGVGGQNREAAETWARAEAGDAFEVWPQPDGDLGYRMHTFFEYALRRGDRAVLIGTDSPNLPPEYIEQAFKLLRQHDVVIGPASDGGYYLIGQRQPARNIFGETEWSSSRVFEQTAAQVRREQATLGLLPVWYDVDTVDDARMLWAHLLAAQGSTLARTREQLQLLFGEFV